MALSVRKEVAREKPPMVWPANRSADREAQSLNAVNHGETALIRAVCFSGFDEVKALIDRGADVNTPRADGFTPLLLAIFFGKLDVVRLLVESGADLKASTRFETTAQIWANARGFHEIADYLQQQQDAIPVKSPKVSPEPLVIRKLSDPLPIWDLVHENESHFRPTSAFFSRITASKFKSTVVVITALVIFAAGVLAVSKWNPKSVEASGDKSFARTVSPEHQPQIKTSTQNDPSSEVSPTVAAKTEQPQAESTSAPWEGPRTLPPSERAVAGLSRNVRRTNSRGSQPRVESTIADIGGPTEVSGDVRQSVDSISRQVSAGNSSSASAAQKTSHPSNPKVNAGNSQLIERRSAVPTAKAKTIQWP